MQHGVSLAIFAAIILFGLYRRTRRTIGYQRFAKKRMITRMTIFVVVGVLILLGGIIHPYVYVYDAVGVVAGAVLAYYAMRTTAFESTGDVIRYRPNPWIGVVLIVLFFGRIVDRMFMDYKLFKNGVGTVAQSNQQAQMAAYAHDPFTSIVLFTIITYYIAYYAFVIRRVRLQGHVSESEAN
ncbi:CcdC protein domain-containing protein [Alicyclobacillus sp. SO9]|uniref:CcdC protein domain-containing protein n=1 Tax=Alicyclobacillus sp. SO9 TaxID=2665646 RepID=UPI0018E746B0|nr:CcdC protein domain-containing protein [Alicyclobacillus sp. SO9]QQE77062.1 hypothetical protein GI364_13860 [Alicyclobacillus sp. SO9]